MGQSKLPTCDLATPPAGTAGPAQRGWGRVAGTTSPPPRRALLAGPARAGGPGRKEPKTKRRPPRPRPTPQGSLSMPRFSPASPGAERDAERHMQVESAAHGLGNELAQGGQFAVGYLENEFVVHLQQHP